MRDQNAADERSALASQHLFEAMFDHVPMIDVRTPRKVAQQARAEGWRKA